MLKLFININYMSSIDNIKSNIRQGKNLTEEIFKLGFIACAESVRDKGFEELYKTLIKEQSKI